MADQPSLFDMGAPAPASPIWERIRRREHGSLGSKADIHVHTASGMQVRHCCHPTANFPYFIECADGSLIFAPNGRGFQRLALAKLHVEEVARG